MDLQGSTIHVHCRNGDKECKFWLCTETYDLEEAFSFNMSPRDKREIKKILFDPSSTV